MNIAVIGDIHGSIANLKRIIQQSKKAQIIFITGDITGTISYPLVVKSILKSKRISREKYAELVYNDYLPEFIKYQLKSAEKIIKILLKIDKPIFFTHGNSDVIEARDFFTQISKEHENLHYIGNSVQIYEKWLVSGYGYCSPAKYRTPFETPGEKEEKEIIKDLAGLEKEILNYSESNDYTLVGLFHEPPLNSKLDFISNKSHVGSELILNHISKIPYDYVFSGHIHESQNYEKTKNRILINPGPLVNGEWASLDIDKKKVQLNQLKLNFTLKGFAYKTRDIFK